jgi:hypothetical protein
MGLRGLLQGQLYFFTNIQPATLEVLAATRVGVCVKRPVLFYNTNKQKTPLLESTSGPYRPSDRRLLAKLVPTFADRGCHVVSVTDPLRP